MTSILLTGPAIEPISLEETKTFLRIEHNDEDQLIAALATGARSLWGQFRRGSQWEANQLDQASGRGRQISCAQAGRTTSSTDALMEGH